MEWRKREYLLRSALERQFPTTVAPLEAIHARASAAIVATHMKRLAAVVAIVFGATLPCVNALASAAPQPGYVSRAFVIPSPPAQSIVHHVVANLPQPEPAPKPSSRYAPKRRWREPNCSSACAKCAAVKSGHNTGVVTNSLYAH